jgi:hypothetical protein
MRFSNIANLHRVVEIALRQEQSFGGLVELRAQRGAVDEQGGGPQRFGIAVLAGAGHDGLLTGREIRIYEEIPIF